MIHPRSLPAGNRRRCIPSAGLEPITTAPLRPLNSSMLDSPLPGFRRTISSRSTRPRCISTSLKRPACRDSATSASARCAAVANDENRTLVMVASASIPAIDLAATNVIVCSPTLQAGARYPCRRLVTGQIAGPPNSIRTPRSRRQRHSEPEVSFNYRRELTLFLRLLHDQRASLIRM